MGDVQASSAPAHTRDERLMATLLSRNGDAGPLFSCTLAAAQKSCDKSKPASRSEARPLQTPEPPPVGPPSEAKPRRGQSRGRPTSSPPTCGPVPTMASTAPAEKRCASATLPAPGLTPAPTRPALAKLPAIRKKGGYGSAPLAAKALAEAPAPCDVLDEGLEDDQAGGAEEEGPDDGAQPQG
eukprot:EG_transcript_28518